MAVGNDFGMGESAPFATAFDEVSVVKVGKREYAVGLLWHKIDDLSRASHEARTLAASENYKADYFCVRLGGDPQFGLGFKARGHKSGLPSLAAQLASAKGGKWLGLFEVENGYYLAAVYDDAIMSECDRFFSDGDAAKEEFENFYNNANWDESIAPENFEIPGTTEVPISQLLQDKMASRLQPVSKVGSLIKLLIALGIVVGSVGGFNYYLKYQEDLELARMIAAEAEKASQLFAPKKNEIVIPDAPWTKHAVPSYFITSCVENINSFPLDIPGWNVNSFVCSSGMVAAALDRSGKLGEGGGSFNWINLMVEKDGFKPRIIAPPGGSGSRASVQWDLGSLPMNPVDLETIKWTKMRDGLLVVMEERFVPVNINDGPSNSDFYRGIGFSFNTEEDPRNFIDVVSALPGAFVTSLSYDVEKNIWRLEGQAYEQLPLPTTPSN